MKYKREICVINKEGKKKKKHKGIEFLYVLEVTISWKYII